MAKRAPFEQPTCTITALTRVSTKHYQVTFSEPVTLSTSIGNEDNIIFNSTAEGWGYTGSIIGGPGTSTQWTFMLTVDDITQVMIVAPPDTITAADPFQVAAPIINES